MPALPALVSTYITGIITSLTQGNDLGYNTTAPGLNYLRAQDTSTILELLSEATLPTANLVATGGTTTSVSIAAMVPNLYAGATITFDAATTTAALQGETAIVVSNTATTFNLDRVLPGTPVVLDEFTLTGDTIISEYVSLLRDGKSRGYAPSANVYGYNRTLADVFTKLATILSITQSFPIVSRPGAVTGTGSTTTEIVVGDPTLKVDEMQKHELVIAGETRTIASNTESTLILTAPVTSAPAVSTAYTIRRNPYQVNQNRKHTVHPGGHPDNLTLAQSFTELVTAVTALTVPA